ncbi:MAG: PKD domain-containing protein [Cyclobacteriaceae bacterium]|nr:PKD domain-containing protein [Cyclobacteriaceae bacterium]
MFFLILCFGDSYAQDFSRHNWFFGNSQYGILFNKSDNEPNQTSLQALPYGNAASAVASDPVSGDLLFYTDGQQVFDASHATMSPGITLNGNASANQGVAISPVPGNPDQYYIFTNTASSPIAGSLEMAIVDMTAIGNAIPPAAPLGVISAPVPILPGLTVNPGMMVFTYGNNPKTYAMLVQDAATGEFKLYQIGAGGPVLVKTIASPGNLEAANFSFHQPSGQIAVSPHNQGANIQILQFDPTVDTLAFVREIPNSANNDTAGHAIYDVEFSPDGNILFVSRYGDMVQAGELYRYDLNNPTASLDKVNPGNLYRSFGLQTGPDGRLYHLYQQTNGGSIQVGRIVNPNDTLASNIIYQPVPLGNNNFNGRQFPSFSPAAPIVFSPNTFEVVNATTCERTPTKFYPNFDPPASFHLWDFGDPGVQDNTSNLVAPLHTYSAPGTYQVRLIAGVAGSIDTTFQVVEVIAMPDSVDLGQDTVICPNESLVLDAGGNWQLYRWSNNETGQTITVDSSNATGDFWVVASNGPGGCKSYDIINIEEYGEEIQNANFWYFGTNAGIDFNEQPPVAVTDGLLNTPEGSASISDRNGNSLFYTDGEIIYDKDHLPMINGDTIGGDNTSSQSSIIVPFPGDETLFYVFSTKEVFNGDGDYQLNYAVVDIKEIDGGTLGSVVTKDKPLFEKSTERITATNAGDFVWLIAHEMGNNTFRAYPISADGIGNPVLTSIGSSHELSDPTSSQGYMKLSPDGSRLAVAFSSGGTNYVEIFDFDGMTGTLSNYLQIELPDAGPYQAYGVEFSGDAEKLFATVYNPTSPQSKLYELKLYNYEKDSVEKYLEEIHEEPGVNMGAIQTGPDGQVYVARDGQQFLGTITVNFDTLQTSTYMEDGFDLLTGRSGLGLPNFVQSYFQQPQQASATVMEACIDQTSTFTGNGTSIIDEFLWTFGDGGSATTDTASHIYTAAGIYDVAFNVTNRCGLDTTITQQVDISGYPDEPTIPQVDIICVGPLTLDADTLNTPGKSFFWSTGETTKTIEVTQPGNYTVNITNAAGCESEGTTEVYDGRPLFDLGPNMTICQGDSLPPLNTGLPSGVPPNTFTWRQNGTALSNNTSSLSINTNNPGVFEYTVSVLDGLTGCVNNDTIVVTINPTPNATYTTNNSSCGNSDGQIDISSPLAGLTAEWFNAQNVSIGSGLSLPFIPAGVYRLNVSDNISGCDQDYPISIVDTDALFNFVRTDVVQDCAGDILDVELSGVGSLASISYTLFEIAGGNTITGTPNSLTFTIPVTILGNYTLQVQADNCSDQVIDLLFAPKPKVPLSVEPVLDICTADPRISVSNPVAGLYYNWTGPNSFSATGPEVQVSVSGRYTVTATDSISTIPCDSTAFTQVTIHTSPEPLITPTSDGCDGTRQIGVTGLSTGSNYSYLWSTASTAPSITINSSGQYDVTVRDQGTGCSGFAAAPIEVFSPIAVSVSVDQQACENDNMVTLTANVSPPQDVTYAWFLNGIKLRDETASFGTFNEGLYEVEVTDVASGLCTASGDLEINRAPITPSNIEPVYVICPEPPANEVAILAPGDFVNYFVYNAESGAEVFPASIGVFEITEEGVYNFELENAFNCLTYDTAMVDVDCMPVIYAPTAFSPFAQMADNQTFKLFPTFVGEFQIFIYNRWGEMVYYSDDLDFMVNQGWDGTKDGKLLPIGTYAYVIRFRSVTEPERGVIEQPGGVSLIR